MAAWFGDGFDLYALPADALLGYWDSGTTTSFNLGTGRFSGSRDIVLAATGSWLVKSSGSNDAVHHIVCAYQQTQAVSGSQLGLYFQLSDGTTNQCCVVFRSDGAILLTSATPAGTVLATYTGAVTASGTWYAFEFEVVINNATGSFAVRKNGNTSNDFSATSLNTRPGTNNYANKLTVGCQTSLTGSACDDLLWRSDAAAVPWVGDIRCFTRRPASDAAVQWTPSGATVSQVPIYPQSSSSSTIGNNAYYIPFQAVADGTIGSVSLQITTASTANFKCSFFNSSTPIVSGGVPTTVMGSSTAPVSAPPIGNAVFTFSPPLAVTRGTYYFLAFRTDAGNGQWNMSSSGSFGYNSSLVSYASFPAANPASLGASPSPYCSVVLTPTSAVNAPSVSEPQQDAAASYVFSSTVGQADLYTLTGIDSTPTSIIGVTTRGLLQKSDAGTRIVTVDLKSGGMTVHSGSGVLNTTWGWVYKTDLVDPATGSAWTPTGVNSAQIGVTVTG